jgi:hypothetical protein
MFPEGIWILGAPDWYWRTPARVAVEPDLVIEERAKGKS